MDYQGIFKNSGRIGWRNKLLWLFGLLMVSGSLPILVINHLYIRTVLSIPGRIVNATSLLDYDLPSLEDYLNPSFFIGGTLAIVFLFLIIWLVATIGEAALIKGVAASDDGRSPSFRELFSEGVRLLGRFIAIDTVIFFPLFLIALIGLLLVGGGMIAGILMLSSGGATADPNDVVPMFLIIGIVLVFLSMISVPVMLLTSLFRLIAFRSAALEDLTTRPSIRRAWDIVRQNLGQIVVVYLLLYAVSYAFGIALAFIITPLTSGGMLFFMRSMMNGRFPSQAEIDGFLLLMALGSLISTALGAVFRVFYSGVWTLAYREWQAE